MFARISAKDQDKANKVPLAKSKQNGSTPAPLGLDEDGPVREMDLGPVGGLHDRRPWPRPCLDREDGL